MSIKIKHHNDQKSLIVEIAIAILTGDKTDEAEATKMIQKLNPESLQQLYFRVNELTHMAERAYFASRRPSEDMVAYPT